ncbi:DNA damage response protein RcaA [Talaromyces stipitatus ATCC 10500]|uniref:DNA damage response protein RcaA n=1 Tax=Talaromyces stipitatus (strain ATCC 10500 / CBS 375.48 / QM 6759 / NRRL 1006) TaxID=441959 RepID=B8M4C9_TALSN|nr:DNA damage response protein RcaA [Talaromyces stipitatus ATCC 10500]EED19124.1 DNA damage response protein RcaA [Talaromyces stipitatus ATCC 10500]
MWVLESDGDLLGGKRVWLKPGKKYLFGRIKQEGVRHVIQHQSISRKHLVIEVSPVQPGDGAHVHKKSKLTVTDQGSKCGTTIDGVQIRGSSSVLTEDEHAIQLGRYPPALKIKWQPIVLSFSFSSKELKAKDPLGPVRNRLEELDIKTIIPYVEKTTHVVQNKRNTAKGLQALINAKYIVSDSYLDALVYAATPGDLEATESLSPLEIDFDANWPDTNQYLPPAGKEPVQRPAEAFAPNPDRIRVFEGYTFVFCDPAQFENLSQPINNGHGKSLLFNVRNGETTAEELLQFIQNAGGEKSFEGLSDREVGVVLVRFRAKGYENWSIELGNQVALRMDQRVIEQSEFLDAILNVDATSLCRPLPREESSALPEPPKRGSARQRVVEDAPVPETDSSQGIVTQQEDTTVVEQTQTQSKRSARSQSRPFVSRMKNFDDGFDMETVPLYHSDAIDAEEERMEQSPDKSKRPSQQQSAPTMREEEQDEDDDMAGLLPGASAMKRRRVESGSHTLREQAAKEEAPKPKRQKVDVIAAARRHREEEEAAAQERKQQAETTFQEDIEGMTIEDMKKLVIVEEFEVPMREKEPVTVNATDRWDERWNGRKNFKKFRRKGDRSAARSRIQAVIVPLDEVKRKEYGVGDRYWEGNERADSPEPIFRRTSQQQSTQKSSSRTGSQASLAFSEELATASSVNRVRSEVSHSSATATTQTSQRAGQKRTRESRPKSDDEEGHSDDGEELRFKFRRRRK